MSAHQASGPAANSSSLIAFTYRDFRYWVSYRFLSGVAYQIKTVGIGWYLYDTTGSTVALGLAGLFAFLPSIVFALVTGHVADTYNRKLIVALSYLLCAAAMGVLTYAVFTGIAPVWLSRSNVSVCGPSTPAPSPTTARRNFR